MHLCVSPQVVHWEGTGLLFVGLSRGFGGSSIAARLHSRRFRIRSFWTALVETADVHTSLPYCERLLQQWFRSAAGQRFGGRLVGHVLVYLFFTLRLPSIETLHLYISEPLSAARGHNSTRTAIILICVDSFIQAMTAKQAMLTLSPVTHSRNTPHKFGHSLSSYISGWLLQQERLSNPGGLRGSPHLVLIFHTSH